MNEPDPAAPAAPDATLAPATDAQAARQSQALLLAVMLVSACALVYELIAAAIASYVIGDVVSQFSVVIGLYLSAMGLGAWLSRFVEKSPARRFVDFELALALVGGALAPALFFAFARLQDARPVLWLLVGVIGTLVGLELPLLLRILEGRVEFKSLVARVLSADYLGSLVASLVFPLLLMPFLGLVRTSLAAGAVNAIVALWTTWLLAPTMGSVRGPRARALAVLALIALGLAFGDRLVPADDGPAIESASSSAAPVR
ncbi:MAG TPA: hypothetical protein VGK67_04500 [Myxococcales bacterium]